MTDHLNLSGTIGTDPDFRLVGAQQHLARLTFRLASSERRLDKNGVWQDIHTNWYSVTAFGKLAEHARHELRKGQRVLVAGKLRINTFEKSDNTTGMSVEIIASRLGPDLSMVSAKSTETALPQAQQQTQQTPQQARYQAEPAREPEEHGAGEYLPREAYETAPAF